GEAHVAQLVLALHVLGRGQGRDGDAAARAELGLTLGDLALGGPVGLLLPALLAAHEGRTLRPPHEAALSLRSPPRARPRAPSRRSRRRGASGTRTRAPRRTRRRRRRSTRPGARAPRRACPSARTPATRPRRGRTRRRGAPRSPASRRRATSPRGRRGASRCA